jgi:NADH-quinone oxidoreductase subunit H
MFFISNLFFFNLIFFNFFFKHLKIFEILTIIIPLLINIAYFTLIERKIIALIQLRKGPNILGIKGLLQPLVDGLKLILKENTVPTNVDIFIYFLAPIFTFTLSLLSWAIIPLDFSYVYSNINMGILYLLSISSLGVYGIILAGWSSNSKYAFLGAIRSTAQMISYEICLSLILIIIIIYVGSFNLIDIIISQQAIWFIIPFFPLFIMFFFGVLAETNRTPFDLPEAEGELVAGFFVEYSSTGFALFFLGEMSNILLMSSFIVILFFGGWLNPFLFLENWLNSFLFFLLINIPNYIIFILKILFILFLFILVRATLPRYRYDQLMNLIWKNFLPLTIGLLIFYTSIILFFNFLN